MFSIYFCFTFFFLGFKYTVIFQNFNISSSLRFIFFLIYKFIFYNSSKVMCCFEFKTDFKFSFAMPCIQFFFSSQSSFHFYFNLILI